MSDQDTPSDAPDPLVVAIDRARSQTHALACATLWANRIAKLCGGLVASTIVIEFIVEAFLGQPFDKYVPIFFELPLLIPAFTIGMVWWGVEQGRLGHATEDLRRLLKREGPLRLSPEATGALLEILIAGAWTKPMECDIVMVSTTLIPLLNAIQTDEPTTFTKAQRNHLHDIVAPDPGKFQRQGGGGVNGKYTPTVSDLFNKLRPAAVSALGMVGDSTSIPPLERLAKKVTHPGLKAATLHSLEQIRERVRTGPEQMLRASEVPQTSDTLLRAVEADRTPQSEPQQLLRAGSAVSEEERGR